MCKEIRNEVPIAEIQVRADGGLDQVRAVVARRGQIWDIF